MHCLVLVLPFPSPLPPPPPRPLFLVGWGGGADVAINASPLTSDNAMLFHFLCPFTLVLAELPYGPLHLQCAVLFVSSGARVGWD